MMDFGIDFGTTNSACVGIEDGKRVNRFADTSGDPFPSLVIIDRTTGRVYCGRDAWRRREELRESCEVITSVKTLLASGKVWKIAGRTWTPEMVAAQVFLALKNRVKERIGEDILKEAVVAVPVGFRAGKRAALREAARLAGVEIKSFVSEPTAALFCHYGELGQYTRIGIFDWGGGTLDVSIIENGSGRIREVAAGGLNVAGDYIDRLIAESIHSRLVKKATRKISFNEMPPGAQDKMLAACEQAKKDLTWDDSAEIQLVNYGEMEYVRESIDMTQFATLVAPVVERAINCFESCVRQAGMSMSQLDCILMVGGSVNLRPLGEWVARVWNGIEVYYPRDSDWSVARGAASLSISPGQHLVAQTIGLVLSDGSFYPLLTEGTRAADGKCSAATLALVEDDPAASLVFSDGGERILGHLNVPTFGFFREKIEVRAEVDQDLVLRVKARSLNRSTRTTTEWHYDALRLDYQLPGTQFEVTEDE